MVKTKLVIVLISLWTIAIACGFHALMVYKGRAGSAGAMPAVWPRNDLITPSPDKPQLVMLALPGGHSPEQSFGRFGFWLRRAQGNFDEAFFLASRQVKREAWSTR